MKKSALFMLAAAVIAGGIGCKNAGFKKSKAGLEYKIIASGKGEAVKPGGVLKFNMIQKYKDSVLMDTHDRMPYYQPVDTTSLPKEFYDIFKQIRPGDSMVFKILTDSAFKYNFPPYAKKGEYLTTNFKFEAAFADQAAAQADFQKEMAIAKQRDSIKAIAQIAEDSKVIEAYLNKNNIKAEKTTSGVYVEIIKAGGGEGIDTSKLVSVNYTGRNLEDGKPFDSNVDTSFHHVKPLDVNMTFEGGVIKGWSDGLKMLHKGDKARLFIPSSLAYGKRANGPIKANENMVFEIEVLDVKAAPAAPTMAGPNTGGQIKLDPSKLKPVKPATK